MNKENHKQKKIYEFRKKAEKTLKADVISIATLSDEDVRKMAHELQVHQIELDMQNEELRRAQQELEDSRDRYSLLYDFAPFGYFTTSEKGTILESNLTFASMLGLERSLLVNKPLVQFIDKEDRGEYYLFRRHAFKKNIRNTCELKMVKADGLRFYAYLEYVAVCDEDGKPQLYRTVVTDITERKKADDKLRELSHAIDYSSAAIVITGTNGNIEYVNPKFTSLNGYSIEDVIGENPRILQSGKTSQKVYEGLWKTITSGNEWTGELCNRKKNGELYWESASISPVKSAEGVTTRFIAVKDDITERKHSERRLSAQHAVTQVLAESTTIKEASPKIIQAVCLALEWDLGEIWLFDQQDSVLRNTEIWHKSSIKIAEFKTVTKHIIFPPKIGLPGRVWESAKPLWIEDVANDTKFLRASIAEREGLHGAFGFPIIIGGEVLGTFCFFSREIKEPDMKLLNMMTAIGRQFGIYMKRKHVEEALKESEAHLRTIVDDILDNSIIGILILDKDFQIVWANKAIEHYFGLDRKKIIGKDKRQTIREEIKDIFDDPEDFTGKVFATYDNNTYIEKFECHVMPGGFRKERWLTHQSMPIKSGLYAGGRVEFYHDITEHKKIEGVLIQSEKFKSLGTITAGVAHDFNNILAIISGNVQLLEETHKGHGDLVDALRTINRAADDGAEIISKMLKFSKTKQNSKKLISYDIRDLIMQSIDFTKPRWKNEAQAKGINYKIDTAGMKSISKILCNSTELREVFINIISNALDAMPEGGSISLNTWDGDDTVFTSISDTGDGMTESVMKNIFDPFFTTKGVDGTGLGMSMSYGIVNRHGGKIAVESEPGKGSTFTLQFPTTNKTENLIVAPGQKQEIGKKKLRILVVDDEEGICNIMDQFLSRDGHKVKVINNGADAIEIIKTEDFDLVLCDLSMPNGSGYDVIKMNNGLDKRLKIGIITGWEDELKPIEESVNADFILKKPFEFSVLSKHINDAFSAESR